MLLITTLITAGVAIPLHNQMLIASLNPSLAHVRGINVKLLEYVFVLLVTILTVACVKIVGAVLVEKLPRQLVAAPTDAVLALAIAPLIERAET